MIRLFSRRILPIITTIFCLGTVIAASVLTTQTTEGYGNYMYVAGNADNYPLEYYDEDSKGYRGIIPDMLEEISEMTDMGFVYINGDGRDKIQLVESEQVEIVSLPEETELDDVEYFELMNFEKDGEIYKVGIGFTEIADGELVSVIKNAANEISESTKKGICLAYASEDNRIKLMWIIVCTVVFIALASTVIYLLVRIRRIRRDNEADKMIDAETGMGNLLFFRHHFKHTLGDISRNLYYLAYVNLDVGYIRTYYGDNSVEDVLKHTAIIFSDYTRDREISARVTESGFVLAFQSMNDEDAECRLTEIITRLNNFEQLTGKHDKLVFHCAVYHMTSSDRNCELLLFNLKNNCNKILGTSTQIVFCDAASMNRVQEEKKITESIIKGFEKNEFKIYFQFIVDNKSKKIVSAEALSRWENKENGLLTPAKYIDNMESAGLISRHDFYMFDLTCRQLEKWKGTEYGNISLSCNFTRITISEENFIDKIVMIANSYTFDKSKISIEITEDAIERNREIATKNVILCKQLGFKVYLDDLGSGYTSLANLCDYPIDVVKIDRDILLKTEMQKGKELFSGIIALAHSLDIKVICEGVETDDQNDFVSGSDCDYIQGWYYSKVIPVEECEEFISNFAEKH